MSDKLKKAFLMGERIYLKPLEKEDLKGPYRSWINDPEITRYLTAGTFPITDEELEAYLQKHLNSNNSILFGIVEKESGKHIGNVRIYLIDWVNRTASRGIMIGDKSAWGKGYGLEVMNLISEYAFERLNLNKLKGGAICGNKGASRVSEKAGYKKEGVLREEFYRDGTYHDFDFYGLTRSDYLASKKKK